MKAVKYKVTITTETLSLDSIRTLLLEVANLIANETPDGRLAKDDGDCVEWKCINKSVDF